MDPSGLFVVTWFLYLFEDTRVSSGIHPRSYPRNQTRMKENLENTSGISHYLSYLSIYTSRSDWPGLVHGQLADSQRHKFGHTAKLVTPLWELMSAAVCWLPDRAPDFLEKFWPIMAIILHIAACCFNDASAWREVLLADQSFCKGAWRERLVGRCHMEFR